MKTKLDVILTSIAIGLILSITSCSSPYQARQEQIRAFHDTIQSGLEQKGMSREQASTVALGETINYVNQLHQSDQADRQTRALEQMADAAQTQARAAQWRQFQPVDVSGTVQVIDTSVPYYPPVPFPKLKY